jgi:hypothetical protein
MSPSWNAMGYIYTRTHAAHGVHSAVKLGRTTNLYTRDATYGTNEIVRGQFDTVFKVSGIQLNRIEKSLQNEFLEHNIRINGGVEFFHARISQMIEPHLISLGVAYVKLAPRDIHTLLNVKRAKPAKPIKTKKNKKYKTKSRLPSVRRSLVVPRLQTATGGYLRRITNYVKGATMTRMLVSLYSQMTAKK